MTRIGPKIVLPAGLAAMAIGLVWFAQISVTGSYVRDLLGPLILIGLGTGFSFVPISIIALSGVPERSGLASGLRTRRRVGGAVGLAVAAAISRGFAHRHRSCSAKSPPGSRCRRRWSADFRLRTVLAVIGFIGCALAIVILRGVRVVEEDAGGDTSSRRSASTGFGDERVLDRSGRRRLQEVGAADGARSPRRVLVYGLGTTPSCRINPRSSRLIQPSARRPSSTR